MRAAVLRGRLFPAVGFVPVIGLLACGGEGTTTPPVTNPTPTIAIALSASTLSVQQGASGSVTVTVTRGGGFTGAVTLAVEGLPTGVTAPSATIAASATSATLNLSAAASAAAATSALTVRATGTGVTAATASLGLTVTAISTAGSFSLSATPSTLSIAQGASGSVTINIARTNFTGAVGLSVSGAAAGLTAGLSSASTTGNSVTLDLSAGATLATGVQNLTITGTGTGAANATTTVAVTITAASAAGSFTLSAAPSTVSIAQGAAGSVTINIARTNFTGAVGLAVSGASAGLTTSFSSSSVTGNSATLTLTAGATLATGVQNLTITGTGTGVSNATTTVAVTITTGGTSGGGNASWKFCGATGLPLWVAFQDGSGAWTRVTGTGDTYAFNISSARGGVAWVVASGNGFDTQIFYGTQAEIIAQGSLRCGSATGAGKTNTATVAGATAGTDMLQLSLGTQIGTWTGSTATFTGVPAGNVDLIASRAAITAGGSGVSINLNKMIIRRNLNPAAGAALAAIDFGAPEAFDPAQANMTVNGLGSEVSLIQGSYITSNNTTGANSYLIDFGSSGSARTYKGVPAANQAAGDLHVISVIALPSLTTNTQTRQVMSVFKDVTNKSVTLGSAMTAPAITSLAATGYARTRCSITLQAEYNRYFSCDVQQTGSAYRRIFIQHSSEYATGATIVMDSPDFSGVTGFDVNWGLKAGTSATWTVAASGWTGSTTVGNALLTEGLTLFSGTRMGNVTP